MSILNSLLKLAKKLHFLDIFFFILLCAISLALIFFYFPGEVLLTGYQDWLVHAFRIKELQLYGFQSWDHIWSNGISLWRAYQFIPHYITLLTSELLNTSITRSMVLLTIIQFVLFRLIVYIVLRVLKISPLASFLCTLITFDIPHYWKAVGDYSFLFGVTIFPLIILSFIYFLKGKIVYLYPYICGLLFYLHPVVGIYAFLLWGAGLFFQKRGVISISTLIQLVVFIISSSVFWVPAIFKQPYSYTNSLFSSIEFFNLTIKPYDYFGLSLYLFLIIFSIFIFLLLVREKRDHWVIPLFIFAVFMMCLVILGSTIQLPKLISQTQFARGIILIGIIFIFIFAPVLTYLLKLKWLVIKIGITTISVLIFVESINFTSLYAPPPISNSNTDEPIARYAKLNKDFNKDFKKIWTPLIDASSYYGPQNVFYANSYNQHLDSNPIPTRLNQIINYQSFTQRLPETNLDRLESYFKVTGTEYLFFNETSPFTLTLSKSEKYNNLGRIDLSNDIFHVFKTAWVPRNSVTIDKSLKDKIDHFPFEVNIDAIDDQIKLDHYINDFSKLIYDKRNMNLSIKYPDMNSIQINIPENRKTGLIYVNESFDTGWKAYFKGRKQKIIPMGPYYMLVQMDNINEDGMLLLQHRWPANFFVSWILIILIPFFILLNAIKTALFKLNKNNV